MLVLPGYETIYEARFGNDSKIQWVDTFMGHQVQQPVCDHFHKKFRNLQSKSNRHKFNLI